jgi:hypothetical protein
MCWPVATALSSFGVDLSAYLLIVISLKSALPAPPPPPAPKVPWLVAPHDHDWISSSPLCLSSVDSPSMPSIFQEEVAL